MIAALGSVVSLFIMKGMDIWVYYKDANAAQNEANVTMKKIVSELRKIKSIQDIKAISDVDIKFEVSDPALNTVGFRLDPMRPDQLIFYDRNAFNDPDYSATYKESNRFNIEETDGEVWYLKFDLAKINPAGLAFKYYGMTDDGSLHEFTGSTMMADFKDLGSYGPHRFIKIILDAKEGGRAFNVSTVVKLRLE